MSLTAPTATRAARGSAARAPAARVPPPRLRVVAPPPVTRRRLPFAAVCVGILTLALVGLLLLNIALTRGAYDVQALQREATLLGEHEQALTERLAARAAPAELAARAGELGMVASTGPAFIRLSDGAVLGVPQPAQAPAEPNTVAPPPAPSAAPDPAVTDVTPVPEAPPPTD